MLNFRKIRKFYIKVTLKIIFLLIYSVYTKWATLLWLKCLAHFIRCRQFEFQVKIFFRVFLHHLIEIELLITKIYFLALANIFFRSKNTKYWGDLIFWKNRSLSKYAKVSTLFFFSSFWKLFFQIQQHKLYIKKL